MGSRAEVALHPRFGIVTIVFRRGRESGGIGRHRGGEDISSLQRASITSRAFLNGPDRRHATPAEHGINRRISFLFFAMPSRCLRILEPWSESARRSISSPRRYPTPAILVKNPSHSQSYSARGGHSPVSSSSGVFDFRASRTK